MDKNKLFNEIDDGKFKTLFNIEDKMFGVFNAVQFIKNILSYKADKLLLDRNNELKKDNLDECYIVLNGPSLKKVNLMKLNDKDTFTVNKFYRQKIWSDFISKYHVFVEPDIFTRVDKKGKKVFQDIDDYLKYVYGLNNEIKLIVNSRWYDNIKRIFGDLDRIYFIKGSYMPRFDITKVKFDIAKVMTSAFDVAGTCIVTAMSMGYKRIYLLGLDYNSHMYRDDISHFYDDSYKENYNETIEHRLFEFRVRGISRPICYILNQYAKRNNIEIINLTEGSLLHEFPFANFDDVINKN